MKSRGASCKLSASRPQHFASFYDLFSRHDNFMASILEDSDGKAVTQL